MVKFVHGDLFDDDSEAVVNTVNCAGVMGKGVALQFKRRFPGNYKAYRAACGRGEVRIGKMFVFDNGGLAKPKWIINFPTKRDWRENSRIDYIADGLDDLAKVLSGLDVKSVSIPPLGCGLGRLDWRAVRPLIEQRLLSLVHCNIIVHEPERRPVADLAATPPPEMTTGRAALLELAWRYLSAMMSPFVTLLELHKLMYFLQEAGQPLRLRFVKAPHGPYAENLSHVLRRIEGHYLFGYADGENNPDKPITIAPGAMKEAEAKLAEECETLERINEVSRLCRGFETPRGMELLASVHWLVFHEKCKNAEEVKSGLWNWNESKRRFGEHEVIAAINALSGK